METCPDLHVPLPRCLRERLRRVRLFRTAMIPKDDAYIKLGFPGIERFPKDFAHQVTYRSNGEE